MLQSLGPAGANGWWPFDRGVHGGCYQRPRGGDGNLWCYLRWGLPQGRRVRTYRESVRWGAWLAPGPRRRRLGRTSRHCSGGSPAPPGSHGRRGARAGTTRWHCYRPPLPGGCGDGWSRRSVRLRLKPAGRADGPRRPGMPAGCRWRFPKTHRPTGGPGVGTPRGFPKWVGGCHPFRFPFRLGKWRFPGGCDRC